MQVECKVKFSSGAYNTNTVRGCRGSSTSDPETAVRRLARRLVGDRLQRVELVATGAACESTWRITSEDEPKE